MNDPSNHDAPRTAVGTAQGCYDGIDGDTFVGWFDDGSAQTAELSVLVDGEPHASVSTGRARPDVTEQTGVTGMPGFAHRLDGLTRDSVVRVSLVHVASGFDFQGEQLFHCPAVAQMRERLSAVFFAEYYRHRYGFESMSNVQAFEHYLRFGIYADFDPNPWFDSAWFRDRYPKRAGKGSLPIIVYLTLETQGKVRASERFDPAWYQRIGTDLSRADGLLEHYVRYGHTEGRQGVENRVPDAVRQEIGALAAIEPDIGRIGTAIDRVVQYPILTASSFVPRLAKKRFPDAPAAIVCVPYLSTGGADLIATYTMRALQEAHGVDRVVMIVTDRSENSVEHWLGADSRIIVLDEDQAIRRFEDRVEALHALIGYLAPEKIVNINSHACWAMYLHFGKQLSSVARLYANLFCFDYDIAGQPVGYIRDFLPPVLPFLTGVFCDNRTIIDDVGRLYGFSERLQQRLHCVYVPAPPELQDVSANAGASAHGKPILWVGRLARQKRPELLLAVARRMPDQRFVVYGPEGDAGACESVVNGEVANIEYRGVFGDVADLDLSEFSMCLNTSAWEGLPTILIQLMSAGLPIVTSNVGGIGELVDYDTGWLVSAGHDPDCYATEIKQVLLHPAVVQGRAVRGREQTLARHNWTAYQARLGQLGLFDASKRVEPLRSGILPVRRAA